MQPPEPMPVVFMFIDESVCKELDTASLTAVLVPAEQLVRVRDRIYHLAVQVQNPPPNHVLAPIEFHARTMLSQLPSALDDDKLEVFAQLVSLMNTERLHVLSSGYTNWSELSIFTEHDAKLHGLNFGNLVMALQPVLSKALLLPIVDGLPGGTLQSGPKRSPLDQGIFRAFIANVHYNQSARVTLNALGHGNMMSIKGFGNILEPTFSDPAHSPLLQLTDVIGYLLHVQDWAERFEVTGFKSSLLDIARKLDPPLVTKWRGRMNMLD